MIRRITIVACCCHMQNTLLVKVIESPFLRSVRPGASHAHTDHIGTGISAAIDRINQVG